MKVNFYREIENGFELIKSYPTIADDNSNRFVTNFKSVDLTKPEDYDTNRSAKARYDRRRTVYLCCLYRAGFQPPQNFQVNFTANQDVRNDVDPNINPSQNLTLEQATNWWEMFWDIYDRDPNSTFSNYRQQNGHEWADEDLKALLTILTRKGNSGRGANCAGFRILNPIREQHTSTNQEPFDRDILNNLRKGRIVIVDLSLGNPKIQTRQSIEKLVPLQNYLPQ